MDGYSRSPLPLPFNPTSTRITYSLPSFPSLFLVPLTACRDSCPFNTPACHYILPMPFHILLRSLLLLSFPLLLKNNPVSSSVTEVHIIRRPLDFRFLPSISGQGKLARCKSPFVTPLLEILFALRTFQFPSLKCVALKVWFPAKSRAISMLASPSPALILWAGPSKWKGLYWHLSGFFPLGKHLLPECHRLPFPGCLSFPLGAAHT